LVLAIYFVAVANNMFPTNGFVVWGALLAVLSFANALLLGHGNVWVALFGVRCDFLHVPLIFIMGRVLQREDLIRLAKVAVALAIPYTALLVAQFYEPQDAWVNRGVGGSLEGAGFTGALDRFRPPGTFSFISGPSQLYLGRGDSGGHPDIHQPDVFFERGNCSSGWRWRALCWGALFPETGVSICDGRCHFGLAGRPIHDVSRWDESIQRTLGNGHD